MFDTTGSHDTVLAAAATAPPGPDVIATLAAIDPATVSPPAMVDLLVALERQAAWIAALTQPALAAVGDAAQATAESFRDKGDSIDFPLRAAHAEIGAALRLSDQVAATRLDTARELSGRLAAVNTALAAGDISFWHAAAITDSTRLLDDAKAVWVAARVLGRAAGQTVGQLRRCLRRAVLSVDPASARRSADRAHADRKLSWWALPDGMAELRLIASATDVMNVYAAADALAHRHAQEQPVRSDSWQPIDARRADALVELATGLLRGNARSKPPAVINVTMDLPTVLGLQDNPAELAGYGPLPAHLARALAADGKWRRFIHEPLSGALLDLGRTTYTPSEGLDRYIRARDPTCGFPTCNRAAAGCDLDHTKRYGPPENGPTDRANLGPLCRHHHLLKHRAGWTLTRDPNTAAAIWTSSTGHTYLDLQHDQQSREAAEDQTALNNDQNDDLDDPDPDDWFDQRGQTALLNAHGPGQPGYITLVNDPAQLPDPLAPTPQWDVDWAQPDTAGLHCG
jgi:Domain of unknown function (DUF222)